MVGHRQINFQGVSAQVEGLLWEYTEAPIRIGRDDSMTIRLPDVSVSPQHAEILAGEQGWMIRDLGSGYGTFVNGVRLAQGLRRLRQNDLLQFGKVILRVTALVEEVVVPLLTKGDQNRLKMTGSFVTIQVAAQRTWEQGLETLAQHDDERLQKGKHFLTLLRAGYHLARLDSLEEMLQSVLDDILAVFNAQRGTFVLRDPTTGQLRVRAFSCTLHGLARGRSFSQTLAHRCLSQGQSLLCQDSSADSSLRASQSVLHGEMTSIICALVRSPRKRLGILHLDRGLGQGQFCKEDFHLADAIAATLAVGIESALLLESQRGQFLEEVAHVVYRAAELRDPFTGGHCRRVTEYSAMLAAALKLSPEDRRLLQIGAQLHDIGKMGIDDVILRKSGKLSSEELETMKAHPVKGAAMMDAVANLAPVVPIIRQHHERWDGRGYPDGLAGNDIHPLARIIGVTDAFDAMTAGAPYGSTLTADEAFAELQAEAGTQFDPTYVEAFLALRPQIEARLNEGLDRPEETVPMHRVQGQPA
jgi:putative nucleotidyltransferase with HDIG domain